MGNQAYRTLVATPADVLARFPFASNIQDLCKGTVKVDGVSWKLRCDPAVIAGRYAWFVSSAFWPDQAPPSEGVWRLRPSTYTCFDMETGVVAPDVSVCAALPKPTEDIEIPTVGDGVMRVLEFDEDALVAALPYGNAADLCKASTETVLVNDATQTWRRSCTPGFARNHFKRVASTVSNVSGQGVPLSGAGTYQVTTSATGFLCIDTDTGQEAAETWRCTYMPLGADAGYFDVPSIFESQLRVIEFDWDWLLQRSPALANKASWCSRSVVVTPAGAAAQDWVVSCEPGAARMHYERYASTLGVASSSHNILPLEGGLALNASGVKCRDTDTGLDVDTSKCTYVNKGALEGIFRTPMIGYSRSLRRVALVEEDLRRVAPSPAQATTLCSGSTTVNIRESSSSTTSVSYKISCDAEAIREHYERVSIDIIKAGSQYNSVPLADGLTLRSYQEGCRDTDPGANNRIDPASACENFPGDPIGYFKVPGKVEPQLRRVSFKRADVLAVHPYVPKASIDALCTGTMNIRRATGTEYDSFSVYCDNEDALRLHHQLVARSIVRPSTSASNALPLSGGLVLRPGTTACRDTDSQSYAELPAAECSYLSDRTAADHFAVPVQGYDTASLTVRIRLSDVTALHPWLSDPSSVCGLQVLIRPTASTSTYSNYTTVCI